MGGALIFISLQVCQLVLESCPLVVVEYCLAMFPNDLDLWAWLLDRLLGYTHEGGSEAEPLHQLYLSLYKGTRSSFPP